MRPGVGLSHNPEPPGSDAGKGSGAGASPSTHAAARWEEIVRTSHDGLAILDPDLRFEFVSDTFGRSSGMDPDAMLGRRLAEVLPHIDPQDMERVGPAIASQQLIRFEYQQPRHDQMARSVRLTLVPRPDTGAGSSGAILLSEDITAIRAAQMQRRQTQKRLTAVEHDEHRRVSRQIHDGPVQLLAALALRLSAARELGLGLGDLDDLRTAVGAAGNELRRILSELSPTTEETPATLLAKWTAPMTAGTALRLEIIDECAIRPSRVTMEAFFVFVHEVVRGCLDREPNRDVQLRMSEVDGGYGIDMILTRSHASSAERGMERAQVAALSLHARALGGAFETHMVAASVRRVHVTLPNLDEDSSMPSGDAPEATVDPHPRPKSPVRGHDELSARLTDADWEVLGRASHEGLMEIDADLRVTSVNSAYASAMKRPASELVGLALSDVFQPDDFDRLWPYVENVVAGEAVRLEWQRRNAVGDQRWTRVAASPRLDADGNFEGALLVTVDTTELHIAQDLAERVLADLDRAQRLAEENAVRRIHAGPMQRLTEVATRLDTLIAANEPNEAINAIRDGLARSIADLRGSLRHLE